MSRIKVKPCPICGIGIPRLVHYAIPMAIHPDGWEETEDCMFEPIITYKKVECANCGAAVVGFQIQCDEAYKDWNYEDKNGDRSLVVQYVYDEELEVEE